ncbi:proline-rich protein 11-like [Lineus longissimus]|uniref:proline-rich protein 11-like n=1 Tax=Lineus longissimus TaxID=88925 RepID=UPI00315D7405
MEAAILNFPHTVDLESNKPTTNKKISKFEKIMGSKKANIYDLTLKQHDVYAWQKDVPPKVKEKVLEDRRKELLDLMPAIPDPCEETSCDLIKEWITLVEERNNLLQQRMIEEDQRQFDEHIKELYGLLQKIGSLDKSIGHSLRQNLASAFKCVKEYCQEKDLKLENTKSLERGNTTAVQVVIPLPTAAPVVPALSLVPVPPPVPVIGAVTVPPVLPVAITEPISQDAFIPKSSLSEKKKSSRSRVGRKSMRLNRSGLVTERPDTPRPKMGVKETPHQEFKVDLRARLSTGRRSLRVTPVVRSPGGTPAKRARRLSPTNPADLMTMALRRKFKRALLYSPNRSMDTSDNSANISID